MKALFFGSIGTLVETSEVQREAFNRCFTEHGLDWHWSRENYRSMLSVSGGRRRIATEAENRGVNVDAGELHRTKTRIFQAMMREGSAKPRPGVVDSIQLAKELGLMIGLVTSTSPENVEAVLSAISGTVDRSDFDVVVDIDRCDLAKPAPDGYRVAMTSLDVTASDCLAVEDNVDGVKAAKDAGLRCLANPGANTVEHDYSVADEVTTDLFGSVRVALMSPVV